MDLFGAYVVSLSIICFRDFCAFWDFPLLTGRRLVCRSECIGGLNLVSCSSDAMPPLDMAYRMLRAVIDVAANAEMDAVSVVPVTAVTPIPPVVNNINLCAGNSDGSNWWRACGESCARS